MLWLLLYCSQKCLALLCFALHCFALPYLALPIYPSTDINTYVHRNMYIYVYTYIGYMLRQRQFYIYIYSYSVIMVTINISGAPLPFCGSRYQLLPDTVLAGLPGGTFPWPPAPTGRGMYPVLAHGDTWAPILEHSYLSPSW